MKVNPWNDQLAMYYLSVGAIEVDQKGRIWKVKDKRGDNKNTKWRDIKPRELGIICKEGYLRIGFRLNCHTYNMLAHRIVWLFYNGLIPEGLEINHKNGIKTDNRPENLELVTMSGNMRHRIDVLGYQAPRGEQSCKAKIKEQDVRYIRILYAKGGITYRELGKTYGLTSEAIGLIVRRVNWAHVV